jgi:hypothetical protein
LYKLCNGVGVVGHQGIEILLGSINNRQKNLSFISRTRLPKTTRIGSHKVLAGTSIPVYSMRFSLSLSLYLSISLNPE